MNLLDVGFEFLSLQIQGTLVVTFSFVDWSQNTFDQRRFFVEISKQENTLGEQISLIFEDELLIESINYCESLLVTYRVIL